MAEVTMDRAILDRLLVLLGDPDGDLRFLLPFFETNPGAGEDVQDISSRGLHATNVVAFDNVPVIRGNLLSYRFNGTDEYLEIPDNVLLSAVGGGIDIACSWGIAFKLDALSATIHALISKGDMTTPNAEWQMSLTAAELPQIQTLDDSVGATGNLGTSDATAVDISEWYIMISTYDGRGTDDANDGMNIYLWNGGAYLGQSADTLIDGAGAYVDMEVGTGGAVRIGASNTGAVAAEFFDGEIMMPWMTMKELSAEEARLVAQQMIRLMEL